MPDESAIGCRRSVLINRDEVGDHDNAADASDNDREFEHDYSSNAVMRWMIRLPTMTRNTATPSNA